MNLIRYKSQSDFPHRTCLEKFVVQDDKRSYTLDPKTYTQNPDPKP